MDENSKTLVLHILALNIIELLILSFRAAQIAALQWNKVPTKILAKYSDYADVFFPELAMELPENMEMNEYDIELIDGKQPSYGPIYAFSLVELETLKAYIEIHLKTGFIRPFKSPADTPILFDKKPDDNFCLCMDYWGLNNLTIKNRYPFPLIEEALDRLGRTK